MQACPCVPTHTLSVPLCPTHPLSLTPPPHLRVRKLLLGAVAPPHAPVHLAQPVVVLRQLHAGGEQSRAGGGKHVRLVAPAVSWLPQQKHASGGGHHARAQQPSPAAQSKQTNSHKLAPLAPAPASHTRITPPTCESVTVQPDWVATPSACSSCERAACGGTVVQRQAWCVHGRLDRSPCSCLQSGLPLHNHQTYLPALDPPLPAHPPAHLPPGTAASRSRHGPSAPQGPAPAPPCPGCARTAQVLGEAEAKQRKQHVAHAASRVRTWPISHMQLQAV